MGRTLLVFATLVVFAGAGVAAIFHLKMEQVVPSGFAGCRGNLTMTIALALGAATSAGIARYYRYAAFGPLRTLGGLRAFLRRTICMWGSYALAALFGLYAAAFIEITKAWC
jgi:hypothetical protein